MQYLKNDRMISVHFQGKPFKITVIQVYALTSKMRSWTILWRSTRSSRTDTPSQISFHYRGLECKSRKSRNTWTNRQIWPWSTEWNKAKTKRVLPREHTGHRKHPLPQHKRRLYTWTSPDGQHDYILCSQRWRSSIESTKTRPGADCGSDRELLIAKFRLILKKVQKPLDHSGMT